MKSAHQRIEIYVKDNSQEKNLLCKARGYRRDIFVKVNENFYKMNVFSFTYLKQYLQNQYELEKVYCIEPNLLIVRSVSKKNIIDTILKQAQNFYFDEIKKCKVANGLILFPLDDNTRKIYLTNKWPISIPIDELVRLY